MAPDGRSFITAVGLTERSVFVHDSTGDRQISLEGCAHHPRPGSRTVIYDLV